jgi:hypothetical protein
MGDINMNKLYITLNLAFGYSLTFRLPGVFVSKRHPGAF